MANEDLVYTGEEGWAPDAGEPDTTAEGNANVEPDEPTGEEGYTGAEDDAVGLEEFFADEDEETGVETGDADLPNQTEAESESQQSDADSKVTEGVYRSQAEVDAAIAGRLKKVRENTRKEVEAEYAAKFGTTPDKLSEKAIEARAHELMTRFPTKFDDIEYAKEIAKGQLANVQTPQTQQDTDINPEPTGREALQERLKAEEAQIQLVTGDKSFSVAKMFAENKVFNAELIKTGSVHQAFAAAKEAANAEQAKIEAAKQAGKREAVQSISKSGKKATTTTGKGQGARKVSVDNMTEAELERLNEAVLSGQGKFRL